MNIDVKDVLSRTFIFSGLSNDKMERITSTIPCETRTYGKNENIFLPTHFEKKIGFIAYGECLVEKYKPSGESVPLNILKPYASFGIMAVLSVEEEFPTRIVASKESAVVFISQSTFLTLIEENPDIAKNVIGFLARKVSFLNNKLATFSSDSVTEKVASHIYSRYLAEKNETLTFNCKKTAETINVGRASVYRALSTLCEADIIEFENKKIYIKDPKGLERITK